MIDYQGKVVPVIDLRSRFQLPRAEAATDTRILVFNASGDFVAATVDAVLEVSPLTSAQVAPPPPLFRGLAGEYLRGVVRRNDRLIIFLDVARLLSTSERLSLEEARAGDADAPAPAVVSADDAVLPSSLPGAMAGRE